MLPTSLFTLLATGVAMVAAQYATDSTTTETMTMTQTITITKCNPTNPNCPAYSASSTSSSCTTSTTPVYPVYNTTVIPYSASSYAQPSSYASTYVAPTVVAPTGGYSTPASYPTGKGSAPSTVVTAGASGVVVRSGLLLGAVGAGIALLA